MRAIFICGQQGTLKKNNNMHLKHSASLNSADVKKAGIKAEKLRRLT
jgi:hypothetical protein